MTFKEMIEKHKRIYPLMAPTDFGKLCYQSEFGPRHLGLEYDKAFYIKEKADDLFETGERK